MSITANKNRVGNFTSSEIVRLMGMGKRDMTVAELAARPKSGKGSSTKTVDDPSILNDTALSYIIEKNMERRLARPISTESNARPLTWGHVLERRCFDLLGTSYKLCSDVTLDHPDISFWKGSPDGVNFIDPAAVVEEKCPITPKSFCELVDPLYEGLKGIEAINALRFGYTDRQGIWHDKHNDAEKYYWQMVSNGCITGHKFAELIIYMPYLSELEEIRDIVRNWDEVDQNPVAWIHFAKDEEMPWLVDGGYYKNLNIIRFEIPIADRVLLRTKVEMAGKLLQNQPIG